MSDDTRTAPDATTATDSTASTPGNGEPRTNLTDPEIAELVKRAFNDGAAKARRAIEADPKISRARELERIYSAALAEPKPEPTTARPTGSKLEQLMEHLLAMQLAEKLPKAPAPAEAAPVPVGARIDEAVRQATAGLEKGSPSYHAAASKAARAILRTVKVRGG